MPSILEHKHITLYARRDSDTINRLLFKLSEELKETPRGAVVHVHLIHDRGEEFLNEFTRDVLTKAILTRYDTIDDREGYNKG